MIEWLTILSALMVAIFAFIYVHFSKSENGEDITGTRKAIKYLFFFLTIISMMFTFYLSFTVLVLSGQVMLADAIVPFFVISGVLLLVTLFLFTLKNISYGIKKVNDKKRRPNI